MAGLIFIAIIVAGTVVLWRLTKSSHGRASQRLVLLGFFAIVILAVLLPEKATWAANFVGIGRGADLVLYLTSFGLMFLAAMSYLKTKRIEERIAHLVSEQATVEALKQWDVEQK